MQIQKIFPSLCSDNSKNKNEITFKNRLTFDVGASDPRGSLKILVQDNEGEDLFVYKGFVNNSTAGFKNNEDFIHKIAKATDVESLLKKDMDSIKSQLENSDISDSDRQKLQEKYNGLKKSSQILKKQSAEEKKITGFALLLPGTMREHTALFMANLKKTNGKSLINVDLDKVVDEMREMKKIEVSDEMKFMPAKDLAGTGLGIASKLINHKNYSERLSKGFFAVAVQTGGGFGAVDLKMKTDNEIDIETNECGHDLYHDIKTGKEKRLGKLGASASSVIENFAKELGIKNSGDINALTKTGLAQLATQSKITLNNSKDKSAIKVLLDTEVYEIIGENSETTTLSVKDEHKDDFNKASKVAIHAYADALALHAITRINRGANLYIVSGPLAMGLNKTIKASPEVYEAKNMRDLIFNMIDKRVGDDLTCNLLRDANKFDVVCSKSLSVDNNTSGGASLLESNDNAFARRGEWLRLPIDSLKN